MSEMSVFDTLENAAPAPAAPANTDASAAKKAKLEAMKQSLKETIHDDPTFLDRMHSLSKNVEVVNSLGFGENGNIIVDKSKSTKENRALTTTSVIVGYRIRNIGAEPIPYKTENWVQGEDGRYVAQKVEKVMAPGATADLTRQYMTMFCAQPEISFQLANGKVIRGSGNKAARGDIKAELEAYYFAFDKSVDLQINADEVKLNVGEKGADGKWHVRKEFVDSFGYLENAPEKTRGAKKESGNKFTSSDLAANFVMKMIQESSL